MRTRPIALQILGFPFRLSRAMLINRRQFDLPRWTGGPDFADLHAPVVAWLDSHLEVVEEGGAPWLRRIGADVWDYCSGVVNSRFDISLTPRLRATVGCTRSLIVVYGFDGELAKRLDQLAEALSVAGWRRTGPQSLRPWVDADGYAILEWQASTTLNRPSDMNNTPPRGEGTLSPHMRLSWSSRGQATRLKRDPNRTQRNTRNQLTVESSGVAYWELSDAALARHDHALAVQIELSYYANRDALARPYRLPRHILPTQPRR